MVAGSSDRSGSDFTIARYNIDGSLDPSFGIQGQTTTDLGATDEAFAVALQTDGKIIVAGSSRSAAFGHLALVRYNSDGSLDTTFGIEGISTEFPSVYSGASAVVLQPDGKIVVAGSEGRSDFALARYNSDGSLDLGYGIGGKVTTDFSGRDDQVYALALQRDGKIVAAGRSNDFSEFARFARGGMAFARYDSDGSLDPTFGIGGQVMDSDDYFQGAAYAVALQPDGKIVAAGGGVDVESGLRLRRLNENGSPDTTFAIAGKVNPFSAPDAWSLTLQSDGKIVIGTIPLVGIVSLARYNADGSLDPTSRTRPSRCQMTWP